MVGYVPDLIRDIPSWIWDMVTFRTWIFQIGNSDLGCPKSKFRFGDVPNQIRNKVVFGLQQIINLLALLKALKM